MNIQNHSINGMNQGRDTTIEPAYMKNYSIQNSSTIDTKNYNELINKPQINGVTLVGDKTLNELGTYTKAEIDALTDNLFNMTPIGVTYGEGKIDPVVLDSDGLPLVAHNRPILINFGDENQDHIVMCYYMRDVEAGTHYEGYKFYGGIDAQGSFNELEIFTGYRISIYVCAINPQNGNIYDILYKDITNI